MPAVQPANYYHFEDEWFIPYPREVVWDVMADARLLPAWWTGVYLKAEPLGAYDRPSVGARIRGQFRGFLPYRLNVVVEATELDRPRLIAVNTVGDLSGTIRYDLMEAPGGTKVLMHEQVLAEKRIVKLLTPLLKPLFAANHRWASAHAQTGLTAFLKQRASP